MICLFIQEIEKLFRDKARVNEKNICCEQGGKVLQKREKTDLERWPAVRY